MWFPIKSLVACYQFVARGNWACGFIKPCIMMEGIIAKILLTIIGEASRSFKKVEWYESIINLFSVFDKSLFLQCWLWDWDPGHVGQS